MGLKFELFDAMNNHLLYDDKPSEFFIQLDNAAYAEYPFTMLSSLKNTHQSPVYHPEGSVWNHTMLVVDEAALAKTKSSDDRVFMWAALLHDIGKPDTTVIRKAKITSYDHDKLGGDLTNKFLKEFSEDEEFIDKVAALVRWHMQILYVIKSLPFADIKSMKKQTSINDVALLGLCDRLGRLCANRKAEEENILLFLEKCRFIS
jgi:putative nucleotidyltransferase with HDIG domain